MTEVHLSSFNTGNFNKGAGFIKQTLWYFVNALFVRASWNPFMGIKMFFLKLFGAKIGKGLVIKNNVNIKFPPYCNGLILSKCSPRTALFHAA